MFSNVIFTVCCVLLLCTLKSQKTKTICTKKEHRKQFEKGDGDFFHEDEIAITTNLWASASEPAGSVPSTVSKEREVGNIALWPQARAC